jgi:EPS-associated MarR family transcriptional regulator
MNRDEAQLRLLALIQARPDASQREMAASLGLSLGKTNYCLRALVDAGLVKARNFAGARDKKAYVYRLTPKGVRERAGATVRLLRRKSAEYEALRGEIEALRAELEGLDEAAPDGQGGARE